MTTTLSGFRNNRTFSGREFINGTVGSGATTKTWTIPLGLSPDLVDIMYNGPTEASDPRPADAWFKEGIVYVLGQNSGAGYTDYPTIWVMNGYINGDNLVITATYVQAFTDVLTLDETEFFYRLVDYSVF